MNAHSSVPLSERPSDIDCDDRSVPAEEINALLKRVESFSRRLAHRRLSPRNPLSVSVPVIPVDEHEQPVDQPFIALSRDISASGICVINAQSGHAKYLVVELRAPGLKSIRLVVEVLRRKRIGRFYEIAGQFIRRASQQPASGETGQNSASTSSDK